MHSVIWYRSASPSGGRSSLPALRDSFDYGNRISKATRASTTVRPRPGSAPARHQPQEQARFLGKMVSGKPPVSAQTLRHRQPDASARHRRLADPRQDRHGLPQNWMAAWTGSSRSAGSSAGPANRTRRSSSSTPLSRSRASSLPSGQEEVLPPRRARLKTL